jgi:hypothetical protein
VWLSRSTTTTTGLSVKMFQKEKIGGGRLVGYIHTHTPMDGMGGKQVTEYEGAITFFGGIVVFMSRKNYYHFPLDEE